MIEVKQTCCFCKHFNREPVDDSLKDRNGKPLLNSVRGDCLHPNSGRLQTRLDSSCEAWTRAIK